MAYERWAVCLMNDGGMAYETSSSLIIKFPLIQYVTN